MSYENIMTKNLTADQILTEISMLTEIEGLETECNPTLSGWVDCEVAIEEGADPDAIARCREEADDALINAMGRRWVLRVALRDTTAEDSDEAWEAHGAPWCRAYNAAYRARAELAAELDRG